MRMRYFYTEPLAILWMMDKFNMKFEPIDSHIHDFSLGAVPKINKAYIHPDSLYLLEPKELDVVESDNLNFGYVVGILNDEISIQYYTDSDGCTDYGKSLIQNTKIIQRNNQPFFWPESEQS